MTTPQIVTRNWGEEITVVKTRTHCGKVLKRKKGTKGGFQFHVKEESHYLHEGKMLLRRLEQGQVVETIVEAGQAWTVPPLFIHQEEALEDSVIFEVSDPTENDRYGIEPDPGNLPSMSDADALVILQKLEENLKSRAEDCHTISQMVWEHGLKGLVPK